MPIEALMIPHNHSGVPHMEAMYSAVVVFLLILRMLTSTRLLSRRLRRIFWSKTCCERHRLEPNWTALSYSGHHTSSAETCYMTQLLSTLHNVHTDWKNLSPEPPSTKWREENGWNFNLGWTLPLSGVFSVVSPRQTGRCVFCLIRIEPFVDRKVSCFFRQVIASH